jgi:hypothetical protein
LAWQRPPPACPSSKDAALTFVPPSATYRDESSRPLKDGLAEASREAGARGGARGRACNPLSGGPGIMPAGTMTGVRGASLEVGAKPAVISAAWQSSHEAWPGSHQGTTHPLGRAVVERRKASRPERGGAAPPGAEGPLRLPAFHFPSFSETEKAKRDDEAPPLRQLFSFPLRASRD